MPRMDALPTGQAKRVLQVARAAASFALCAALTLTGTRAYALFIVNQPWVKPGARTSEAYMVLTSTEGATLIGVRSPVAASASLRAAATSGERVRATFAMPAGLPIALRPGAERIALSGLSRPLKLGQRVALTLTIETAAGRREEILVDAEVRNESPLDAERRAHHR